MRRMSRRLARGAPPPMRRTTTDAAHLDLNWREIAFSQDDLRSQDLQELGQPVGVGRPGRGGDQLAVHQRLIDRDWDVFAARQGHLRPDGGIGGGFAPFQHPSSRENLRAVADSRYWLFV